MIARYLVTAAVAAALFHPTLLAADPPPAPLSLGDNAALKYWIAFSAMPTLTEAQKQIIAQDKVAPKDDETVTLLDASAQSLDLLQRASRVGPCAWGIFEEDGQNASMPHLAEARQIARLALFRARCRLGEGKDAAGVEDILSVMRLARHCAAGNLLSLMVGLALEGQAVKTAAVRLPQMRAGDLDLLADGVDRLGSANGLGAAILCEKRLCVDGPLRAIRERGTVAYRELIARGVAEHAPPLPAGAHEEGARLMVGWLEDVGKAYAEWATHAATPPSDFARHLQADEARMKENPFAGTLVPALVRIREQEAQSQVRLRMLRAAVAVLAEGKERLKDFPDPFGDGPFEMLPTAGGFELRSALVVKGEGVTLKVGP